ncbi:MAG: ergothioneine biosynthesis protein EgtB [Myxococcales bacterium]|nr:ergothioneine biosynthesis protein EgtB [Myxococcales bacterium]
MDSPSPSRISRDRRAASSRDASALAEAYQRVRAATEALAAPLSAEDQVAQSMADASPTKWHRAHTTWFFETFVLGPGVADYAPFHPAFAHLFNSYYVSVGTMHARPQRGLLTRPPLATIAAYRRHVDAQLLALLGGELRLSGGLARDELLARVEIGLHHEQQHQELIVTDLKHLLSHNPIAPVYRARPEDARGVAAPLDWIAHEGGVHELGFAGAGFHFDNEGPRHRVFLEPFALASRLVTNAEYQAFIDDDGYARPELWLSDGWATSSREGWRAPLYWRADGRVFTLAGERARADDEPVCHVSYYEADAYARWAGARLASEQEWEIMARASSPLATSAGVFADHGRLHPAPAAASTSGEPAQLFGDVWEWTSSAYAAYPNYRPLPGALGEYNGKFMCNQFVLRGGSCATPRDHIRATYRNFFYPPARWQFSGIRLARSP